PVAAAAALRGHCRGRAAAGRGAGCHHADLRPGRRGQCVRRTPLRTGAGARFLPAPTQDQPMNQPPWTLSRRAERMNPSVLREILKVTERPGIISFAGGLPSPKTFPVSAFAEACAEVLATDASAALQYAASEGHAPLREWVAQQLPWAVDPAQVLITTGSQQGLDLAAKVLIDSGSRVLVESPTYLGALQAFAPMEPAFTGVAGDEEGIDPDDLRRQASGSRFVYLLPNFQNPTGRSMSEARRAAVV